MKILLVSHDFLPRHAMGTEVYTLHLGKSLRRRGHEVHVFTTEKDIGRQNLTVRVFEYDGLPVHELTNNLFYNDFRETWDYPPAAKTFGDFLDDFKPDVVHFMHLMYLSVACAEEVARRGIPVFYTLHDYWLQCARFGQRKHVDGSICHDIDFDRCGGCMSDFKFRQTRVERATAKAVARVHSATGIDLGPTVRGVANALSGKDNNNQAPTEPVITQADPQRAAEIAARDKGLRERLLPNVGRFLAPSEFLRQRFLEWGIPEDQITYLRTGIDLEPFEGFQRAPSADKLRVAFVGTVAPHKGTHLLLEAWGMLSPELRERGDLTVYGPLDHYPAYRRQVQELAERCGASLPGVLSRAQVVERLGHIDLLVIPSVWYENSPLTILEAMATRTPLLVSDLGGMAELVEDGVNGFHFRVGDAAHLAEQLQRFFEDRSLLDELYAENVPVQSIEYDAAQCETLYVEARAASGS